MQGNGMQNFVDVVPIAEDDLRDIGRNIGKVFRSENGFEIDIMYRTKWVKDLLQTLLATVHTPSLSVTHQITAVDALCSCLEQCIESSENTLISFVCSSNFHTELYIVYIDHLDATRTRSLKQFLSVFIKVLGKSVTVRGNSKLVDQTCRMLFDILDKNLDRLKAKQALLALTFFVSKSLLRVERLSQLYGEYRTQISPSCAGATVIQHDQSQALLNLVLYWVSVPDLAPVAGHFVSTLLSQRPNTPLPTPVDAAVPDDSLPIWVQPVLHRLQDNPQGLQSFKSHAFPALFRSNPTAYWKFLVFLGIENLLSGQISPAREKQQDAIPQDFKHSILFVALQIGKTIGFVRIIDGRVNGIAEFRENLVWIQVNTLGLFCGCSNAHAQTAGLSLMISSPTITQSFTPGTLRNLRRHLPHLHTESNATTRSEVFSLTNMLMNRLRAVMSNISHKIKLHERAKGPLHAVQKRSDSAQVSHIAELLVILEYHQEFLYWLLDFVTSELHTNASYQRHVSALRAVSCIVKSGLDASVDDQILSRHAKSEHTWPFYMHVFDTLFYRSLVDLLLDPFDDIRQNALELLKTSNTNNILTSGAKKLFDYIVKALKRAEILMIESGRLDHADGVARCYDLMSYLQSNVLVPFSFTNVANGCLPVIGTLKHLVQNIEASIEVAKASMHEAVGKYSIHGLYSALRYVLEEFAAQKVQHIDKVFLVPVLLRITKSFSDTWQTVHYLLCNDAPEGFVPEDMEDEPELTTKDALSYAWRALKESSLVLRSIVMLEFTEETTQNPENNMLSLKHLGDQCFTQLAELRHRGAFSTVAQTFAAVCQHCSRSQDWKTRNLIREWYKDTLLLIGQRGSAITRRSAGIPAIMTALLSADPNSSLFSSAISDLRNLSKLPAGRHVGSDVTELPQVHALNSLRAIFTTSKLGSRSEQYVGEIMGVAADCLSSNTWAIRNCGLMLFRSLIDRLLGSDETQNNASVSAIEYSTRMSYDNHPGLLGLLVQLLVTAQEVNLHNDSTSSSTEALFPVLDLIRRAPPPNGQQKAIGDLVLKITSSANWHIRDIAARTFAALTSADDTRATIEALLMTNNFDKNKLHGHLFCVKYLVKDAVKILDTKNIQQLVLVVINTQQLYINESMDDVNLATYVEIMNEFGYYILCITTIEKDYKSLVPLVTLHLNAMDLVIRTLPKHRFSSPLYPLLSQAEVTSVWISQLMHAMLKVFSGENPHNRSLETQDFVNLLLHDGHAAQEAVKSLCNRLSSASTDVLQALLTLLAALLPLSLNSNVRSAIELAFMETLRRQSQMLDIVDVSTVSINLAKTPSMDIVSAEQPPSIFESSISIWGSILASRFVSTEHVSRDMTKEARLWIRFVRSALDERNAFPLRYAATMSLYGFSLISSGASSLPVSLLPAFMFAVYDTLIDDDDEIRILGADIVPSILPTSNKRMTRSLGTTPPLAAKMLCSHIVNRFERSPSVVTESLARLLGQKMNQNFSFVSAKDILHAALNRETVLFDEEKPNLYIDPVREADTWSRVLKRLSIDNCPQHVLDSFSAWTSEGLDTLLSMARSETDGPLGWTSKPDVFAIGMRVFCAADVSLEWRTKSRKIKLRGSDLRRKLGELAHERVEMDIHGLWLKKIDQILSASVEKRVRRVGDVLASLPVGVC